MEGDNRRTLFSINFAMDKELLFYIKKNFPRVLKRHKNNNNNNNKQLTLKKQG